jgi:hypothetical protein
MRFEVELKKLVGAEIERLRDELEAGLAVKDYAQYKDYVGRLASLRKVLGEYYDEVQTKLNKD